DRERFADTRKRVNISPLGSGALAGSTLPIDRRAVASKLGFADVSRNSIDGTGDRDFITEFLSAAALCAGHLSRIAEDWILYSTSEFHFIRIADAFCTGSSMMPQKRNPDVLELIRGKTARVYAALVGMLTLTKGLPQAYNRDLQEDKVHLFSGHDTLRDCLEIAAAVVRNTDFLVEHLRVATQYGFSDATVLAEYLVGKRVPFRQAHQIVGTLVARCEKAGCELRDAQLEDMQAACDKIGPDIYEYLGADNVVARYQSEGSGGPVWTHRQIEYWKDQLA
ncbi:MAG: argininosuccinate lyase, partial [Phycisphaerae bacterium]|nr:argininosuccinate lyase [Phycisphaerae bacterium]